MRDQMHGPMYNYGAGTGTGACSASDPSYDGNPDAGSFCFCQAYCTRPATEKQASF